MDEEIRSMLCDEIKREIESLSQMQDGSREKSEAIDDLAKLYRLHLEETKTEAEFDEQQSRRFMEDNHIDEENELKREQLQEQKRDRLCRLGAAAAEVVLPLIFYGIWMRMGFKFEQDGVYTSMTFKNLLSRFRPTK